MPKSKSKSALSRKAIIMDIGGFRPPEDPFASWFGKVNLSLPGESWPLNKNAQPMLPLCQLNLSELPFKPEHLSEFAMITVFIGPVELPVNEPNGSNWCLRAYNDLSALHPLEKPLERFPIKALPMRARIVEHDYPSLDDAGRLGLSIDDEEEYQEKYPNSEGFKLSGWPTLVQSEISWPQSDSTSVEPEYVFQIDSSEKAQWQWGHGGVGYCGRRKGAPLIDEWAISWQSL